MPSGTILSLEMCGQYISQQQALSIENFCLACCVAAAAAAIVVFALCRPWPFWLVSSAKILKKATLMGTAGSN